MTPASSSAAVGRQEFSLAELAVQELERRRGTASRKVAAGDLSAREANAHLQPWLALACRAGADLPEFADPLAELRAHPALTATDARILCADDIAPLAAIRAALATARDDAIERAEGTGDAARTERARGLDTLARAFGAPPYPFSSSRPPSRDPALETAA